MAVGSDSSRGFVKQHDPMTGGVFSQLMGGDEPQYNETPLDLTTQDIINQKVAQGNQSQQDLIDMQMRGTSDQLAPSLAEHNLRAQGALGGHVDENMASALQQRAQRLYGEDYNQQLRHAQYNAPGFQAGQQQQAFNSLNSAQNIATQQNQQLANVTMQRKALRNQAISALFMGGGEMAGTYFGAQKGKSQNKKSSNSAAPEDTSNGWQTDRSYNNDYSDTSSGNIA